MHELKIATIGAGPAGLLLARLLQNASLCCTVFESEDSRSARNQGGTLDLHATTGQLALHEAGLIEEFAKYSRPEGEAMKLVQSDGTVIWDENEMVNIRPVALSDRPEIDRIKLRDILLDSLKEGTVRWGKKVARVEIDPRNRAKYTIFFADGTMESDIDLLVGADGAWSRVRPLLTDEQPFYSGISSVELWCNDVDVQDPWLSQYIGAGSMFSFHEGQALQCQRNGNGSVRVYASCRQPEDWHTSCGIDWCDQETARQELVERYWSSCSPDLQRVILSARDELIPRKLYMLPVGVKWESQPGVTLLGDAAHLMTPFAGVGVNVALTDALELARALIARKGSFVAKSSSSTKAIHDAIVEYEREMFVRAEQNARRTEKNLRLHFSQEGGMEMVGRLQRGLEMLKAQAAERQKCCA